MSHITWKRDLTKTDDSAPTTNRLLESEVAKSLAWELQRKGGLGWSGIVPWGLGVAFRGAVVVSVLIEVGGNLATTVCFGGKASAKVPWGLMRALGEGLVPNQQWLFVSFRLRLFHGALRIGASFLGLGLCCECGKRSFRRIRNHRLGIGNDRSGWLAFMAPCGLAVRPWAGRTSGLSATKLCYRAMSNGCFCLFGLGAFHGFIVP